MGNNQVRSLDDFPEGFTYVRAVNQAPFKNCRIFQKNSTKQQIAVMLLDELPKDVLKFRGVSEYLVDFIDWCKEDINLCGAQSSVSLFYEYCPTNLEAEIMKKKKQNEYFSESQIWYVLNAIVNLESDLSVKSLAHADIRPCNVLIAQNDMIKFAPAGYFPYEVNSFKKQFFLNEQTYLAPENRDPNLQNVEWQTNDVYAAGLTILDMMTLQLSNNEQKSREAIQHRLNKSRYNYSAPLCDFVEKMLKEKTDRINFKQIKQQLLPFQKQINTLQPFELSLSENPQKLSRSLRHSNERDLSPQERVSVTPVNPVNPPQLVITPSQSNLTIQRQQSTHLAQDASPSIKVDLKPQIRMAPSPQPQATIIPQQFNFTNPMIQSPKVQTLPDMRHQLLKNSQPQLVPAAKMPSQNFVEVLGIPKSMSFAQPQRSITPTMSVTPSVQQQQPSKIPQQLNSQYTFMPQTSNRQPLIQQPSFPPNQLQQIMRPIQQTRDVSPIQGKNIQSSPSNNSIYLTPKIGLESRKPSTPTPNQTFQRLTPNTQSFTTTPVMRGQSIYSPWGTDSIGDDHMLSNTLRKAENAISLYHSLRHKV